MSKALACHLNANEELVAKAITKLEELSGFKSEDVRLMARTKQDVIAKIESLELDPADTTSQELFHSLQARLASDLNHLARALNLESQNDIGRAIAIFNKIGYSPEVMAIKPAAAKQLLRRNPPKKSMKLLGYRSLESMLKRANLCEVFAVALSHEPLQWLKAVERDLYKFSSSDFEWRKAEIIAAKNLKQPVSSITLFGAVAYRLGDTLDAQKLICNVAQVVEANELLAIDSFYLSVNKFNPNFGRLAAKLLIRGEYEPTAADIRQFFDWQQLRSIFEDSIGSVERVAAMHPALNWWKSAAHLSYEGVSLNIIDNLKSLASGSSYSGRQHASSIDRLKTELLKTYHQHESVKNYFASPFDDTLALANNPEPALDLEMA